MVKKWGKGRKEYHEATRRFDRMSDGYRANEHSSGLEKEKLEIPVSIAEDTLLNSDFIDSSESLMEFLRHEKFLESRCCLQEKKASVLRLQQRT